MSTFLDLIVSWTKAQFLSRAYALAEAAGLPVTSWRVGDPTRTQIDFLAEQLEARDLYSAELARAACLSTARGEWLKVRAREEYGVEPIEATYSTPTVTIKNNGGGYYTYESGDLTFSASSSGVNFRITSGGTLTPGGSLTFTTIADTAGSDGTVALDEIDTIVTKVDETVAILSSTAAIGLDGETDDELKQRCRDTLAALSPNGPADVYAYVAKSPALTGRSDVAKAKAYPGAQGTVDVRIIGFQGEYTQAMLDDVQVALDRWATPLTVTATTNAANLVNVNLGMTITAFGLPEGADDLILAAVMTVMRAPQIEGTLTRAAINAAAYNKAVALGGSDVSITFDLYWYWTGNTPQLTLGDIVAAAKYVVSPNPAFCTVTVVDA